MTENTAADFAQEGTAYAGDTLEKSTAAAEQATRTMQQAYTSVSKNAVDFNLQLIEIAKAHMNAAFDFMRELLHVQSPSEFIELSAEHARKQWEILTAQMQQLTARAQKVTAGTAHLRPL